MLSNRMILLWAIFGPTSKCPSWTCHPFDVSRPNLCPPPGSTTPGTPPVLHFERYPPFHLPPLTPLSFSFQPLCVFVCVHISKVFIYQLCMVELEGKRGNRVMEKLVLLLSALITRHHHNVSVFSSAFIKQTHCSGTACTHACVCVCVLCTETDGAITTTEGAPERF